MKDYYAPLFEGQFFHVYNRGNDKTILFYEDENYRYFLSRLEHYILPYAKIHCYCLLPNHFHLLIEVRDFDTLAAELKKLKVGRNVLTQADAILSEQFKNFFNSYAKAIRKRHGGKGSLFQKRFKRKCVQNNPYLLHLVNYIHRNPQTHGLHPDYRQYPFSSFNDILQAQLGTREREVLQWFGTPAAYARFHEDHPIQREAPQDAALALV